MVPVCSTFSIKTCMEVGSHALRCYDLNVLFVSVQIEIHSVEHDGSFVWF